MSTFSSTYAKIWGQQRHLFPQILVSYDSQYNNLPQAQRTGKIFLSIVCSIKKTPKTGTIISKIDGFQAFFHTKIMTFSVPLNFFSSKWHWNINDLRNRTVTSDLIGLKMWCHNNNHLDKRPNVRGEFAPFSRHLLSVINYPLFTVIDYSLW